jgi:hypothetical protein
MKYRDNSVHRSTINNHKLLHREMSEFSNSRENDEVVRITNGFRPDFDNQNPIANRQPLRTLKTFKAKKKKGKRVMKRIHYEGTSDDSSHSSLISEYIDPSQDDHLSVNSKLYDQANPQENDRMAVIPEDEEEDDQEQVESLESPIAGKDLSSPSPADEHYDSEANLVLERNSPRESFRVFNQ